MTQQISDHLAGYASKHISLSPDLTELDTFFCMLDSGFISREDKCLSILNFNNFFLFGAVVSGSGCIKIGSEISQVSCGECFFIDCSQPFSCISSENDPWEVLWLHFGGSSSQHYFQYFSNHFSNILKSFSFSKIIAVIQDILICNEHFSETNIILTSKLIVKLLTIAMTTPCESVVSHAELRHKLAGIHNFIEEHFSDDLSLETIASQFYISKYYLTREYKKIYGKTIFQHIISLRISHGKQLLRFSDKSVEEIAQICGFNDQSYFAKQFKKYESMTCFEYRKIWKD